MNSDKKSKLIVLGYDAIDHDHEDFIKLIAQLAASTNNEYPALFQQLFVHTEQHCEYENQLMEQYAFPATAEHKGEHMRVLGEFKEFKKRVDKGLIAFGRSFAQEENQRLPIFFWPTLSNSWFECQLNNLLLEREN